MKLNDFGVRMSLLDHIQVLKQGPELLPLLQPTLFQLFSSFAQGR